MTKRSAKTKPAASAKRGPKSPMEHRRIARKREVLVQRIMRNNRGRDSQACGSALSEEFYRAEAERIADRFLEIKRKGLRPLRTCKKCGKRRQQKSFRRPGTRTVCRQCKTAEWEKGARWAAAQLKAQTADENVSK
ncbi:MAG: hypothetical protein NXI12_12425 [Alphaproteobacteria bacterium]|nr:hypothetical protein [Alphaproteobacteria bacterium]